MGRPCARPHGCVRLSRTKNPLTLIVALPQRIALLASTCAARSTWRCRRRVTILWVPFKAPRHRSHNVKKNSRARRLGESVVAQRCTPGQAPRANRCSCARARSLAPTLNKTSMVL
ncbi:hypothetical protein EVAR_19692_1 [Eumeta japonica]|uniref:Uncharacterized protein n=1 Tax=Eumeta variegata TaxID=151549 RepID=A0A4C1V2S5_EUMVA|nr:hypothetical protein EVAR_19692_1 [Eumeta japonica]